MPRRIDDDWQDELKRELARAGTQFARGLTERIIAQATEAQQRHEERDAERLRNRHERRVARRLQRREAKFGGSTKAQGWIYGGTAIALVLTMIVNFPNLWWLIFVALWFGKRSADVLTYQAERGRELPPDLVKSTRTRDGDARRARVDETCDRLLEALKDAPADVKAFLSRPDETVGALRQTCHDLLVREAALRSLANPEHEKRLSDERMALSHRIEHERDPVTKQRLESARDALDEQQRQHAELSRQAGRLDAEFTRLTYTLDGLYAQVMRMKTVGVAADSGAGLRLSLEQLRSEIGALADALEEANAAPVTLVDPAAPDTSLAGPAKDPTGRVRS